MPAFRSQVKILGELSRKYVCRSLPSRNLEMMKSFLFIPGKATLNHRNQLFLEQHNYRKNVFSFFKKKNKQKKKENVSKEENTETQTLSRVSMCIHRFTHEKFVQYFMSLVSCKQTSKNNNVEIDSTSRINKISTDISEPKPEISQSPNHLPQILLVPPKSDKSRLTEVNKKHLQDLKRMGEQNIAMQKYELKLSVPELTPPKIIAQEKIHIGVPDILDNSVNQNYSLKNKNSLKPKTMKRPHPSNKNTTKYEIHSDSQISEASLDKQKAHQEFAPRFMRSPTKKLKFFKKGNNKSTHIALQRSSRKKIVTDLHRNVENMGTTSNNFEHRMTKTKRNVLDSPPVSKTKRSIKNLKFKTQLKSERKDNTFSHHNTLYPNSFQKVSANRSRRTLKLNTKQKIFRPGRQAKVPEVHTVGEMKTKNSVKEGNENKWIHRSDIFTREITKNTNDGNEVHSSNSSILSTLQKNNNSIPSERTYIISPPQLSPDFIIKTQIMRKNIKIAAQDILAKYNLDKIATTVPSGSLKTKYQPLKISQLGTKNLKVPNVDINKTPFPSTDESKSKNILGFGKVEQVLDPGYENNLSIQKNLTPTFTTDKNETVASPNLTSPEVQNKSANEEKESDQGITKEKESKLDDTKNNNLLIDTSEQINSKNLKTTSTNLSSSSSLVPVEFYTNIRNGVRDIASLARNKTILANFKSHQNNAQIFHKPLSTLNKIESKINSNIIINELYKGILDKKSEYLHLFSYLNHSFHSQPELTSIQKHSSQLGLSSNKQQPGEFHGKLLFKSILLKSLGGPILLEEDSAKTKLHKNFKTSVVKKGETHDNNMYIKTTKVNILLNDNARVHSTMCNYQNLLSSLNSLLCCGSKRYYCFSKQTLSKWGMRDPTLTGLNSIECKSSECKKRKIKKRRKHKKVRKPKRTSKKCKEEVIISCKKIRLPGCRKAAAKCREMLESVHCVRRVPPQPSFSECLKFPLFVKKFSECDCHKKKIKVCESEPKEVKHYDACNARKVKEKPKKVEIGEECK